MRLSHKESNNIFSSYKVSIPKNDGLRKIWYDLLMHSCYICQHSSRFVLSFLFYWKGIYFRFSFHFSGWQANWVLWVVDGTGKQSNNIYGSWGINEFCWLEFSLCGSINYNQWLKILKSKTERIYISGPAFPKTHNSWSKYKRCDDGHTYFLGVERIWWVLAS